jgi:hypothetical protein
MIISETDLRNIIQESIRNVIIENKIESEKRNFIRNIVENVLKEERWDYGRGAVGREDHFQNKAMYIVNNLAKKHEKSIKGIMIPPVDATEIKIPVGNGQTIKMPCSDGEIKDYVWVLIPVKALENRVNKANWERLIMQLIERLNNFGKGGEYVYDYDYNPKRNLPGGAYAYFRMKKEPIYVPRDSQDFNEDV